MSHNDADHVTGLPDIIKYLQNPRLFQRPSIYLISPLDTAERQQRKIPNDISILAGDNRFGKNPLTVHFRDGRTKFQVVYPATKYRPGMPGDVNFDSLVVGVYVYGETILLTGDQSAEGVRAAMYRLNIQRTTIFQQPHHGSKAKGSGNIFVPSTYYIISGLPKHNLKAQINDNYRHNQDCQELIAQQLLEKQTNHGRRYLVMTQSRIGKELVESLESQNIGVIRLNVTPLYYSYGVYCTITLRAPSRDAPIH